MRALKYQRAAGVASRKFPPDQFLMKKMSLSESQRKKMIKLKGRALE